MPNTLAKPTVKAPGAARRRVVTGAEQSLVEVKPLRPEGGLPLLVEPTVPEVDLLAWAAAHRGFLEEHLLSAGGLLFRNFRLGSLEEFKAFIAATTEGEMLQYKDATTPRSAVSGNVYTSTEYPPDQEIFFHCELAYSHSWPLKLLFFCVTAPEQGGATPIADTRRVLARIRPEVRRRFAEAGVLYVRNYGHGLGLPWQDVFKTRDRSEVEAFCRAARIELEWLDGDRLRTRAVRRGIARHPRTGEEVWFNSAALFHLANLAPEVRQELLAEFAEDELAHATFYGDGTSIESEVIAHVRDAYRQESVVFPWQQGDLLMLDNMLAAHGRQPYAGPRKIVVGMAEPYSDEGPARPAGESS